MSIEDRFGSTASHYDAKMMQANYRAPDIILGVIARHYPQGTGIARIFDAAAGTGLLGERIKRAYPASSITGADCSAPMLGQAAAKNCYDALLVHDLSDSFPGDDESYDLVVSCGATEYIGNTCTVIAQMARIAKPGALIVSTFMLKDDKFTDFARDIITYEAQLAAKLEREPNPVLPYAINAEDLSAAFEHSNLGVLEQTNCVGYQRPGWDHPPHYHIVAAQKLPVAALVA